ncbi:FG-GAP-like repeat-containing protein [Novipirellula herctigrandis]|uniref:FG-GAP-like repeat-containing protein n=1 Tax=Novipirellula herctigrandis TaxID=2527986 RepID=UPI003AF355C2
MSNSPVRDAESLRDADLESHSQMATATTNDSAALSATPVDRMTMAVEAFQRNDLDSAKASVRGRLVEMPDDVAALELSGDIAVQMQENAAAINWYETAVENSDKPTVTLLDKWVESLMRAAFPFETLDALRQTIDQYPTHVQARFDLIGLAAMIGLPRMTIEDLQWLNQHNQGDAEQLVVLAEPGRVMPDGDMCERYLERNPGDIRLQYSLAVLDVSKLQWEEAIERLARVIEKHPDFLPAHLLLGVSLVETNRFDEIAKWHLALPPGASVHPEYWIVAGHAAQARGDDNQAARAFWKSLQIDDVTYPDTLLPLLLSLNRLGREEDAQKVADQIRKHSKMRDSLKTHIERKSESQQAAMRVGEAMLDLGRVWEAEGWARLSTTLPKDPIRDLKQRYMAIRAKLTVETPWKNPGSNIASKIDLSELPEVVWGSGNATTKLADDKAIGQIRFAEQAAERGWIHTTAVAPSAESEGHWIYQTVAGGVGVIDFDLDGFPDLSCAMLNGQPLKTDSSPNHLFRNHNGMFTNVGAEAGYLDNGFSQGISVGDYNDDGFPDLLDMNIGSNRLYRNNGDGTFTDVSNVVGLADNDWSTSSAIADIDGDGYADLMAVAYAAGTKPYEYECRDKDNQRTVTCTPLNFEAQADRIWRGRGDGTFEDVSNRWIEQTTPGRALGIIVGNLDERPGLDAYVANDMSVNHLWSGDPLSGKEAMNFHMTDLGSVRGLGFDARSISQASMGMASGDADGDGDLDFFLTHFAKDHNTFYEQVAPGIWADRSYQVGVSQTSMKLLGFGTQWSDFDNNGSLDLIVANGHVDIVDDPEIAFRMPPQLLQRQPSGRWVESEPAQLGEYFQGKHLGRAVALLDADRDGRTDVAITHLFDPVALLVNDTPDAGKSIHIELKATTTQRDAIGAVVKANLGDRNFAAQLTAGDGYMCTNERQITIGTGTLGESADVVVQWPSGTEEHFGKLQSSESYLLVEGSGESFKLPSITR